MKPRGLDVREEQRDGCVFVFARENVKSLSHFILYYYPSETIVRFSNFRFVKFFLSPCGRVFVSYIVLRHFAVT